MREKQDGQQALRSALVLIGNGILTPRAGRALAYFNEHGVFCEAIRFHESGEIGIVFMERWYTPAAFNALWEGRYDAPTDEAAAEPTDEPASEGDDDETPPSPDDVVRELRADATANAAKLEEIHQASSEQTDGEGALAWGLVCVVAVLAVVAVFAWQFITRW